MDSRQLGYFCSVLRRGSFTKAAEECHISQSAISQQVRALEADLSCELLVRCGRHFEPTAAGTLPARKGEVLLERPSQRVRQHPGIAFRGSCLARLRLRRTGETSETANRLTCLIAPAS